MRFTTNKAQHIPEDVYTPIINWLRYNRRNSQLRTLQLSPDISSVQDQFATVGRYALSNICNMDQTPLPFEYLDGRTYDIKGNKTV